MIAKVAIIAPGAMGSAVGRRLSEHGARVLTSLTKRSIATVRRAEMTGMIGADDDAIAQADVILSILPPNEAFALAERFAAPLSRASHKAIFADCNAINVETVRRIDAVITPTGAAFVDGGIIGPPPGQSGNPTFYFSGQAAPALAGLCDLGLKVRIMKAPLGAASALKMSYAGINKGTTLLAAAMLLGATRAGAADALRLRGARGKDHGQKDRLHKPPDVGGAWRPASYLGLLHRLHDIRTGHQPGSVSAFAEPRIEPEIMLGIGKPPSPKMGKSDLLDCIDWIALGYEIVQSIFPGWKFSAFDTIAANALHGSLLVGKRHAISPRKDAWGNELATFSVELFCNEKLSQTGGGALRP